MAKLITDPEKIRLQEEGEVQALLGHPPAWLTRWGISIVATGTLGLLLMGQCLRYPDIVEAPAVIQTESPAIRLEAKTDGRIEQLWIVDSQSVDSGQLLVHLQHPVSLEDFRKVKEALDELLPAIQRKKIDGLQLPEGLQLAGLQPAYSDLSGLLDSQQYLLNKDDAGRKIALYQQQLDQLTALNAAISQEMKTREEAIKLAERNVQIFSELNKQGGVGELSIEEVRTRYLNTRQTLEALQRDSINNRLQEQDLRSTIITLSQEQSNEIKRGWIQLVGAAQQMKGVLEEWEDIYLIKAPLAGQVILSKIRSEKQSVDEGETVLTIDPGYGQSRTIARALLPVGRAGKVKPGQQVLLRLPSYPYKEFGVLEGSVEQIAPLPESSGDDQMIYPLLITLTSDSLRTTTGSIIPFTQELPATARIITSDRSFLERIMDEVWSAFREN